MIDGLPRMKFMRQTRPQRKQRGRPRLEKIFPDIPNDLWLNEAVQIIEKTVENVNNGDMQEETI